MIMAPRTYYSGFAGLTDSTNQPLNMPAAISDIPMLETSAMLTNETQGSSSVASRIILGDFTQLMLGVRSEMRIEILNQTFADRHQLGIVAWLRGDVQVAHPTAFAQILGIIP